ncbi:MAG: hypothetical protein AB1345_12445 [Chloroflexota bacterium]
MKRLLLVVGIVVLAVGIVSAVAYTGIAYARSRTPLFTEVTVPELTFGKMDRWGYGPGMMGWDDGEEYPLHEYMETALAEALGLTVEELESRKEAGETLWDIAQDLGLGAEELGDIMQKAREKALAQAVADGVITEEQAEWMLDRFHPFGRWGFGLGMMGWYNGEAHPMHEYMETALADVLGLTVEELETRMEAGETIEDIAEEQGLSADELGDLMQEAHEKAIAQAVADGVISEEQAEWMLDRFQNKPGFWGFGGGPGHCFGTGVPPRPHRGSGPFKDK